MFGRSASLYFICLVGLFRMWSIYGHNGSCAVGWDSRAWLASIGVGSGRRYSSCMLLVMVLEAGVGVVCSMDTRYLRILQKHRFYLVSTGCAEVDALRIVMGIVFDLG